MGATITRKPKLGTGERFNELQTKLSHQPGIKNPAALAAYIGRKKYGKEGFAKLSKKNK